MADKKFTPGAQRIASGVLAVDIKALITQEQEKQIRNLLTEMSAKIEPVLLARVSQILKTEMRKV